MDAEVGKHTKITQDDVATPDERAAWKRPQISDNELEERFGYHRPIAGGTVDTVEQHRALRVDFISFAKMLNRELPDGRAKAVALTQLEDAAMWAHKAVAMQDPVSFD